MKLIKIKSTKPTVENFIISDFFFKNIDKEKFTLNYKILNI